MLFTIDSRNDFLYKAASRGKLRLLSFPRTIKIMEKGRKRTKCE
jgi:hypothetical protein